MKHFFNINQQRKCETIFVSGFSLRPLLLWVQSTLSALQANLRSARVIQGLDAGLNALRRATSNNRTYLALMLICVAGPLASVAYTLFDLSVKVDGWYYVNNFYLFYMLSPHLHLVLTLTGVFFLFPQRSINSFFLIIPVGYHVAKILWLITVTSNDELNQVIPWAFVLAGIGTATVWIVAFDYLMSLHYHKRAGCLARAEGLLKLDEKQIDRKTQIGLALLEIVAYKNQK